MFCQCTPIFPVQFLYSIIKSIFKSKMYKKHKQQMALHSTLFLQVLSFLLLSVTEHHPAVQAMVLSALEEAKPVLTPPTEPISKILKRVTQEVCCTRNCIYLTHFAAISI